MSDKQTPAKPEGSTKLPYKKPQLRPLGALEVRTQGFGGSTPDRSNGARRKFGRR
jgi:hypothetical protein